MADIGRADERLIEVHALDLAVGSDDFERIPLGFDHRRVIADTDDDKRRRRAGVSRGFAR